MKKELEKALMKIWTQASSVYAIETKTGKWKIGYTNDYPLQHGDGESYVISKEIAMAILQPPPPINLD